MIAGSARLCKLIASCLLGAGLAACSIGGLDLDALRTIPGQPRAMQQQAFPSMQGQIAPMGAAVANAETIGRGPVKVALLLPLSGDPSMVAAGQAMANGARLAMSYIESNPKIADNISLSLRDTGTSADGAARQAQAAVAEGASLVLGPVMGDQVGPASMVTRSANLPMIAFSSNGAAAGPGVYLLSVLPEVEVRRALSYAKAQGKRRVAGLFPATNLGSVHKAAFEQGVFELGLTAGPSLSFSNDGELMAAIQQLAQEKGVDALYLPDRQSAGRVAAALGATGVKPGLILGSSQWTGANELFGIPSLSGAVFPAVDDAGLRAITPEYVARFGTQPLPLATIAYTAVILVNNSRLSLSVPKFDRAVLTSQSGFTGRDGVFRFLADGRSQYALVIKRIGGGGASVVDGAKL